MKPTWYTLQFMVWGFSKTSLEVKCLTLGYEYEVKQETIYFENRGQHFTVYYIAKQKEYR